jgi:hypothetical protein
MLRLLFLPIYIPLVALYWFCWIVWNGFLFLMGVTLLGAIVLALLG